MVSDGVYQTYAPYAEIDRVVAERPNVSWVKIYKEDAEKFLAEDAEKHPD